MNKKFKLKRKGFSLKVLINDFKDFDYEIFANTNLGNMTIKELHGNLFKVKHEMKKWYNFIGSDINYGDMINCAMINNIGLRRLSLHKKGEN